VFKAHYHTILRLKSYFPFSLIDAMGSLEEARQQIMRELRYQSSLDLDEATYAAIRCACVEGGGGYRRGGARAVYSL
jgi:adenylate kinase